MKRRAPAASAASLFAFRRNFAPSVSVLTFAAFLFTLIPPALQRANAAPPEPILTGHDTPQRQAPGGGPSGPSTSPGSGADGIGQMITLPVDTAGAFSTSFEFQLPHARGEAQPSLPLTYSSSNGWGLAGKGWSLGVPFVMRAPNPGLDAMGRALPGQPPIKRGKEALAHDRFFNESNEELLYVCKVSNGKCGGALKDENMPSWSEGWFYYRPRVETKFARYFLSASFTTWRIQMNGGSVDYELGAALDGSNTAIERENLWGSPYKWWIVRAYDGVGDARASAIPKPSNKVLFSYERGPTAKPGVLGEDRAPLYLTDIYDTSPRTDAASTNLGQFAHHTHLVYEARTDKQIVPAWGRVLAWRDRRLARIDVTSKPFAGKPGDTSPTGAIAMPRSGVRRYWLTYLGGTGLEGGDSLLRSIQLEGTCAASVESAELLPATTNCDKLPPVTYGYDDRVTPKFSPFSKLSELLTLERIRLKAGDKVIQYLDVNRDGLVDILATAPGDSPSQHVLWLNGINGKAGDFTEIAVSFAQFLDDDTAENLTPSQPGVFLGNFSGAGYPQLLVSRKGKAARIYTLSGGGMKWRWEARQLQSTLELPNDNSNVRVLDLDGDGASDIVTTGEDGLRIYYSLARIPGYYGAFGSTFDSDKSPFAVSNSPIVSLMPRLPSGETALFSRSDVRLADVNGDHIADLVHVSKDGVRYWAGTPAGFGTPEVNSVGTYTGTVQNDGLLALPSDFASDGTTALRFADVNGDGFDDLVIARPGVVTMWPNLRGDGWGKSVGVLAPSGDPLVSLKLADIFGRGRQVPIWDVGGKVVVSDFYGENPLLRRVSNGYGATTDIGYSLMPDVELAKRAAAEASADRFQPLMLATSVTKSDNLNLAGGKANVAVTRYAYESPYFSPTEQKFVGFRTIIATDEGDAVHPTSITRVTYNLGECVEDPSTYEKECGVDNELVGNPRAPLSGLPRLIEVSDANGIYFGSTHYQYRLRNLYFTERGWTRQAFLENTQVFRYGIPNTSTSTLSLADVVVDDANSHSTPEASTMNVWSATTVVESSMSMDLFGNVTDGLRKGRSGVDQGIKQHATWTAAPNDRSGWTYRPTTHWTNDAASSAAPKRIVWTSYDALGRTTSVSASLSGTIPLVRSQEPGSSPATPPLPVDASVDGALQGQRTFYDELGNPNVFGEPNGRCLESTLDPAYGQLPTDVTEYVGTRGATQHPLLGPCGGTSLRSFATYDRGFEAIRLASGYNGERIDWRYDGFGRLVSIYPPHSDPAKLGETMPDPGLKMTYPPSSGGTVRRTLTETLFVDATGVNTYRQHWLLQDGFDRTIAMFDEADPSAGDTGAWIVRGVVNRSARGTTSQWYMPWFWNGAPASAQVSSFSPTSKSTSASYDAIGRVAKTFDVDGTWTAWFDRSDPFKVTAYDAEDLKPSGEHANTPSTTSFDGHGRIAAESVQDAKVGTTQTKYGYDENDNLLTITQSLIGSSAAPSVRSMSYDSLGRMILNVEPNSSLDASRAWRYAYNDNGDLVGTSDARGCGKNIHYDAGGRVVAEDYWPCLASQPAYSAPNLATGVGAEVFNRYDSTPADVLTALKSTNRFNLGRLTAHYDRGSMTGYRYDARGRTTGVAKRLARPSTNDVNPENGYGQSWFVRESSYRDDDRASLLTTGASQPELMAANGTSSITPIYSRRGTMVGLTSSYGSLIDSITRSPEGLEVGRVYGDGAKTKTTITLDERLRRKSVRTERAMPAMWTASQPGITPAPTASTTQLVLESMQYTYDAVGNPTSISDTRKANEISEWPTGAKPASYSYKYDDLYRVTTATTLFSGGNDAWTSPTRAESSGTFDPSKRDHAAPQGIFANRSTSQTFAYDWLGNTTATTDDAGGFYDRSLGAITNGPSGGRGPNQLQSAYMLGGGTLSAGYDVAGNLTGLVVRRLSACASATCFERFAYDWDEVGRLVRARRWDITTVGTGSTEQIRAATPTAAKVAKVPTDPTPTPPREVETLGISVRYAYDSNDSRVRKSVTFANEDERHTLFVFDSLEVRRARWFSGDTDYERTARTEVPRLGGIGRVVFADGGLPLAKNGKQHIFLSLPGHLGSTSTVIDRETSELVEKKTYQPYGAVESDYRPARWDDFREELGFTGKEEDAEVGIIYFGHRYLQPYLGRWLSPDPLTIHTAGADLNVYAYAGGRVSAATDPTGLEMMITCTNVDQCGVGRGLPEPERKTGGSGPIELDMDGTPGVENYDTTPSHGGSSQGGDIGALGPGYSSGGGGYGITAGGGHAGGGGNERNPGARRPQATPDKGASEPFTPPSGSPTPNSNLNGSPAVLGGAAIGTGVCPGVGTIIGAGIGLIITVGAGYLAAREVKRALDRKAREREEEAKAEPPCPPEAEESDDLEMEGDASSAEYKRQSRERLIREWEVKNRRAWPMDPDTGGRQVLSHIKPLADGGSDTVDNIEPLTAKAHTKHHVDNGDFKRWGARAQQKKCK